MRWRWLKCLAAELRVGYGSEHECVLHATSHVLSTAVLVSLLRNKNSWIGKVERFSKHVSGGKRMSVLER